MSGTVGWMTRIGGEVCKTDTPTIRWIKVREAVGMLWEDNPKEHDIGAICESIQRYGIKELPVYDKRLNGGKGGIQAGNGRIEALWRMEKAGDYKVPRGILVTEANEWLVPVIEGVDGVDEAEAVGYAIDSNNLVMAGGEFSPYEVSKLWGGNYLEVLESLYKKKKLPVSVDGETWIALTKKHQKGSKIRVIELEIGKNDYAEYYERIEAFISESGLNIRIR